MEIQNALGKIEQYWQIIRNLHFHIEQEGRISREEYALIDKYLKVLSQKYKALIDESEAAEAAAVPPVVPAPVRNDRQEESLSEPESIQISHIELPEPPRYMAPEPEPEDKKEENIPVELFTAPEEPVKEDSIILPVIESVASDILAETPKNNAISSFLERMLDDPGTLPSNPVIITPQDRGVNRPPSLNDRLKEARSTSEDLNSRIKRATAEKISLNDKFEFIRELFGNNPVEYATAIGYFDNYGDYAWDKVEREYAEKFSWHTKPGSVLKLKRLVGK